jgi:hypothetical protein
MDDGIHGLRKRSFEAVAVQCAALNQPRTWIDRGSVPEVEVVEHRHTMSRVEHGCDGDAADVPGAADDEYVHVAYPAFSSTSEAFCPPNPKLFFSTTRTSA